MRGRAAVAVAVWAVLAFGHGAGLRLVGSVLAWARRPGSLSADGGHAGFLVADALLGLGAVAVVAVALVALGLRARQAPPAERLAAVVPWLAWLALAALAWRTTIVFAVELTHFAQYAVVGLLVHRAAGSRRPQRDFLLTCALGLVDELWQHYGHYTWIEGSRNHWFDWSDLILNALGAAAGILGAITLRRLGRGAPGASEPRLLWGSVAAVAAVLLPLLWLDPVGISQLLGSYPYDPFWTEADSLKPVHWLLPHEGIPALLGALLILGSLLDPDARPASTAKIAVLVALVLIAVRPPSRTAGRAVHERVPATTVHALTPGDTVRVDGVLDEGAWARAPRLGPFLDDLHGGPVAACAGVDGSGVPVTHARLLWSPAALYVAFEVTDDDVYARDVTRDDRSLSSDDGVRVFLDVGGDELTFVQLDVSPLGRLRDVYHHTGYAPMDYNIWAQTIGWPQFDIDGVEVATRVDGSLDVVDGAPWTGSRDRDDGYVVEMAIPWESLVATTVPDRMSLRQQAAPQPGDRWRLNLYRQESPRPLFGDGDRDRRIDAAAAGRRLGISADATLELAAGGALGTLAAADGEPFRLRDVVRYQVNRCARLQSWSPTFKGPHRASHFGVIEFASADGKVTASRARALWR